MRRKKTIATLTVFAAAAAAMVSVAWVAAGYVEETSKGAVGERLGASGMDWADIRTDGLQVIVTGFAPTERARFRAITEAGRVVDPGRVVDAMDVLPSAPVTAPKFTLEILRNEDDISLIGLMPSSMDGAALDPLLGDATLSVTNMVETADYPIPDAWEESIRFALRALNLLPRAKVSVSPGEVRVTAVADSDLERRRLESELSRTRPQSVSLSTDISAPRPVVAPFTLRFTLPSSGPARFETCAVNSEDARDKVLTAAVSAGYEGKANCVLALGVPSGSWGDAAAAAIAAVAELGGGTVTLSDADVTLVALEEVEPALFERVAAELETALPEIFSLEAVRPETDEGGPAASNEAPEFTATRSPEGQVQLRGRLFDEAQEAAVLSYGRALFGVDNTYMATREDPGLPVGWPARVLVGLEALSLFESGVIRVEQDTMTVRGVTGNPDAEADVTRLLAEKLGAQATIDVSVDYREELNPALNIPTPGECVEELNAILDAKKLTILPGEVTMDFEGADQISTLRDTLLRCERSVFEIGGHTDSQGREEMNLQLSTQRAAAVRTALVERGVPPSQLVARGYGEANPVADNDTEAGREANRRIAFTLVGRRQPGDGSGQPSTEEAAADAQGETGE
ncbi:MAG: OmpA family protein [Pseudomonadota bacterium]